MAQFRVTVRFRFEAAHRLYGYNGPCGRIHGHTYAVEVTLRGETLDWRGMLIDFGELKRVVCPLMDKWDHRLLLHKEDSLTGLLNPYSYCLFPMNPTAEVMARMVWEEVKRKLPTGVHVDNVRVYETPDCWVDYYEK